jgi:serine protease DegQ
MGCQQRKTEVPAPDEQAPEGRPQAPVESPPVRAEPRLGLTLQTLSPGLARSLALPEALHGAVISGVLPHSPAAERGLAVGDVLTAIGGQPIHSADEAMTLLLAKDQATLLLDVTGAAGSRQVQLSEATPGENRRGRRVRR